MDPEAALKELRELTQEALNGEGAGLSGEELDTRNLRIAELFQGLDQWLSTGGFLPLDWTRWLPGA